MATNLVGVARTRAQYELFKAKEECRQLASQRDWIAECLREIEASPRTFDARLRHNSMSERLRFIVRDLVMARAKAERHAYDLGEDADVEKYFQAPSRPRSSGPVKLAIRPAERAALARQAAKARPTVARSVSPYLTKDMAAYLKPGQR